VVIVGEDIGTRQGNATRRYREEFCNLRIAGRIFYMTLKIVIARSGATKQSVLFPRGEMDFFASLAMTG
jgi:hypothetical protein